MQNALAAFKFLVLGDRFTSDQFNPERVGLGTPYFPLVGLVIGFVLAIFNHILEPYLESEILAVVIITILIVLTRATHLEGTRKTFDAFSAKTNLSSKRTPPISVYGFLAVLLIILFKIRSVEVIGETRNLSLLLTPTLARWTLVIFLYGSTSAADGSAQRIAENVKAWHLVFATAVTLGITVFLVGPTGLWVGLCLSLLALLSRGYLHRRGDGLNCNHFGALIEASETLSFVLFACL
jgi:adenosylcobinamide-GDP ribazoletransferase